MTNPPDFLDIMGIPETAQNAAQTSLLEHVGVPLDPPPLDTTALLRQAEMLEREAIAGYLQELSPGDDHPLQRPSTELFSMAFECWLHIIISRLPVESEALPGLDARLATALRFAVAGLASERSAEVRLNLTGDTWLPERPALAPPGASDWPAVLGHSIAQAVVRLTRKDGGWQDIDTAVEALDQLRGWQAQYEQEFLDTAHDEVGSAVTLLAYYHLAETATLAGEFLINGEGSADSTKVRLDRHHDRAAAAATAAGDGRLVYFADLIWIACRAIVENSLWNHLLGLGDDVAAYARHLASRTRNDPVLELWPSQQRALGRGMLDSYKRAVLVEMPTSAGKTLLAKFAIVQTKNLRRDSVIAYIAPTRALVSQITRDLRADFSAMGFNVESAIPAMELDPVEDALLSHPPDVLVTTAEKFSLLLRRAHPSVANVSLVVVDEAHNLADGQRGARLELVLATLRRDRPAVRYLLLSPFVPDADDLVAWLGGDRQLPPIAVNWRPGRKVVGTIRVTGQRTSRRLTFETLDAAGSDVGGGHQIDLEAPLPRQKSIKAVSQAAALALGPRGNTLVLCQGQKTAMDRAEALYADLPDLPAERLREIACRYLEAELGADSRLPRYLRRGLAYHHSGLSAEARSIVEGLLRRGLVHTVCGTTTLAQGVNFPIRTVLVESQRKGRQGTLSYTDFWNIAGRAGRALLDEVGLVGFPVGTPEQAAAWQEFLHGEASAVASQLVEVVERVDALGSRFDLAAITAIPGLGDLLQFLAHAMRVGGSSTTADDVEDLIRSSLVYHQSAESSRGTTAKLLRLCRAYLTDITAKPGQVAMSDQTGFSTPSIARILAEKARDPRISSLAEWDPAVLFDAADDEPLAVRVRAVSDVPEIRMGSNTSGPFSPYLVARILRDWVQGCSLPEMAERHGNPTQTNPEVRNADFARYLHGTLSMTASWGLGALATVCLGGETGDVAVPDETRYVPSMVYFGVRRPEAVWMRMIGVPRLAADGLATLWTDRTGRPPSSMRELRAWIGELSESDWAATSAPAPLGPSDLRTLCSEILVGSH